MTLPEPTLSDAWATTYASTPPGLARQREEWENYEASFDVDGADAAVTGEVLT